ncbi:MAG TPA: hypothetical protein VKM54_11240 [Myxococcota bacterium]|nr:hypothetical protein [Myxococcota bacterium]
MRGEACRATGQIGALLRREGLYSSHLVEWRRLRAHGALQALAAKKRGRKSARDARDRELGKFERENAQLRRKLAQAEALIEVQKTLADPGHPALPARAQRERRVTALLELVPPVPRAVACRAIDVSRPTLYRCTRPSPRQRSGRRAPPPRALRPEEQARVVELLHSERFVDRAPAQIVATLLDEGQYLCSMRTMYRLLAAGDEVRERRPISCTRPISTRSSSPRRPIKSGPGISPSCAVLASGAVPTGGVVATAR